MKRVLFISNGFAEDMVVLKLAGELKNRMPDSEITCLPIVGNAGHFKDRNLKVIGPHWKLPSEGLNYGNWILHILDILCGLPVLALLQFFSLRVRRRHFDLTVTVGDYVGIAAAALAGLSAPLVHVWVCPARHYPAFVREYLRKHGVAVYQRTEGKSVLDESGVQVKSVGNPLLDTFDITGESFGLDKSVPTVGVLPGSRKNVFDNLETLIAVMDGIKRKKKVQFLIALSPKIDRKKFMSSASRTRGWSDDFIVTDKFGDVLNSSDLVIGLARTGNEQAMALGKPVVTFWGKGFSMSEPMVRKHAHRILKKNAVLLPPEHDRISSEVVSLLDDPGRMSEMSRRGREIMGPLGGSKVIAQEIGEFLKGGTRQ